MSDYLPVEYTAQVVVTLLALVNCNWLFFIFQLPLALYHGKMLWTRSYK